MVTLGLRVAGTAQRNGHPGLALFIPKILEYGAHL
jgi:hypothetical protein